MKHDWMHLNLVTDNVTISLYILLYIIFYHVSMLSHTFDLLLHGLLKMSISSRNVIVSVATDVGVYCSIVYESTVSWTLARDLRHGAPRLTLGRCVSLMVGRACLRRWTVVACVSGRRSKSITDGS